MLKRVLKRVVSPTAPSLCPVPHATSCVLHHPYLEQASCKNHQWISTALVVFISKTLIFQTSLHTHINTHTQNVLFLGGTCAFIFCLKSLLLCCWQRGCQVPHTVCTALSAAPEQDSDVFFRLMRYRQSWNVWAYHIALSKATRGES